RICWAPALFGPRESVADRGGELTAVTQVKAPQQGSHRLPGFLPDGRHFLFYVTGSPDTRGVYVGDLRGAEPRRLLDTDTAAMFASSGQLLFLRQGTLFAQQFDPV